MTDDLRPTSADDLAEAIAFALRYRGRKRWHGADEIMAKITAERLVEHLEKAGFVILQKPPASGHAVLGEARSRGIVTLAYTPQTQSFGLKCRIITN